jgi:hypothetical protein
MMRSGGKSLAQQVLARNRAVDQVDVGRVIDYAPVDLFRNALIEAAIARFHVKHGNPAPLRRNDRQAAVGVTQDEHCLRFDTGEHTIDGHDDIADGLRRRRSRAVQEVIRLAQPEIVEKYLVQFVIVVLPGMNQHVFTVVIEARNYARQPDDLRARSNDGDDLSLLMD